MVSGNEVLAVRVSSRESLGVRVEDAQHSDMNEGAFIFAQQNPAKRAILED